MFMDLLWRHHPEDFPDGNSVEATLIANLQNVDITFPVSEAVAKELECTFDLRGAKLLPVPHGSRLLSNLLTSPSVKINQSVDNSGYFLYPAQTTANKNHLSLFEAIKILVEQGLSPKVVCTSRSISRLRDGVELSSHEKVLRQWLDENTNLLEQNIVLRGEVEWEELSLLYNRCRAVVLPSLYEGFGLPLLEAFEQNAPVICSSIPSFLEQIQRYGMADRVTVVDSVAPHALASSMSANMQCPRIPPLPKYDLSLRLSRWTWEDAADIYLRCIKECRLTKAAPLAKGGFADD
jgi:glycosyltransferase involved in cell wall biosynthesis